MAGDWLSRQHGPPCRREVLKLRTSADDVERGLAQRRLPSMRLPTEA
jgi:hypothetical protein